jgi:trans-aconitate 2-methyltransferase
MKAELDFRGVPRAEEEETRAAADLLSRVETKSLSRVADVHAGPWSGGAILARRFPNAEIVSLDPSDLDDRASASARFDLIYFNGDLGFRPSLRKLLPGLVTRLRPGGRLAVQFPNNLYEPNRALLRMVAADGPWAKKLLPVAKSRPFNETMEGLYALLSPVCASIDIWETTYLLAMNGIAAIVDLMKAGSLAPFFAPLDETSQRKFLDRYSAELTRAYPPQPDGKVLLRRPRMFFVAQRG